MKTTPNFTWMKRLFKLTETCAICTQVSNHYWMIIPEGFNHLQVVCPSCTHLVKYKFDSRYQSIDSPTEEWN